MPLVVADSVMSQRVSLIIDDIVTKRESHGASRDPAIMHWAIRYVRRQAC